MTFAPPFTQGRPDFSKMEEDVLAFWDQTDAFAQSVARRPEDQPYIFYDGPPFANGLPHYGHLLGSTAKDVIPRYQTMKGKRVERVWGWDCHGVPIENAIEKELGLRGGKKGIEELGIDKFNQACRASIMAYDAEWKKTIKRLGRWVDFEHAYKTMDLPYMESVWWGFSELYKKGLIYQDRKVVLYCPRCSTPLSNFEIAMDNSYKDVEDYSLYVKFAVQDEPGVYLIAWTTTPWTLPGNVALAVLPDAEYVKFEYRSKSPEYYWVARERLHDIAKMLEITDPTIVESRTGSELAGISYTPLYEYMPLEGKRAHYVTTASFVSLEDGSGIVHTAAIFGEDDYELAKDRDLPRVPILDDQGKFLPFVTPVAGVFYKKAEDWVVSDLTDRHLLFHAGKLTHSYPFCYRCGTPLYYFAMPAWFIAVNKLKKDMIRVNEEISWFPEHLKHGRFGQGLESAPDWNISRSRYWGTPMPIWEETREQHSEQREQPRRRVIGSLAELQEWAVDPSRVEGLTDLHREFLDDIEVYVDDERTVVGKRIFEVFDCWVESGSMPFAQVHYPFENKEKFDSSYPAQFITEYIAQTRAWFYCMHVISVGIFGSHAFENCLTTGTLQAEDGQKMSKSKKNYPDPTVLIDKYGSDCLRLYLMASPLMRAENMNFSEKNVHEIQNKVINILWNLYGFYALYIKQQEEPSKKPKIQTANYQLSTLHVLDRWLLSRISRLVDAVTDAMDHYDVVTASRLLMDCIGEFSTWYLRLSRKRLRDPEHAVSAEIYTRALIVLCKLSAPFIPFITESIYQGMTKTGSSLHLSDWPKKTDMVVFQNVTLEEQMATLQLATAMIHGVRKDAGIKVRQPLASAVVSSPVKLPAELLDVLKEEVNIEQITWKHEAELSVSVDQEITPELEEKGKMREAIRQIQDMRKAAGVHVDEQVEAWLPEWPEAYTDMIMRATLLKKLSLGEARIERVS